MAQSRLTHAESYWVDNPHALRCAAHYKSTKGQCRKEATPGTNVCNQHGALAPAVQARAATRIQMSVDDAVKRLQGMLDDAGVDARDKIKILHDLLDRGGLGATSKHLVAVGQVDPVEQLFSDILTTPGMLAAPAPAPPHLDDEYEQFIRDVLERDDFAIVGEVVERRSPAPKQADPDGNPIAAVEAASKADSLSDGPPKHIRDDLIRLGLL